MPPPVGAEGRFGLADVLRCYASARRLPGAAYDSACDDDQDGRIGIAEALVWYGNFTRTLPGIGGGATDTLPLDGTLVLQVLNVPADGAGVGAQLTVNGETRALPLVSAGGGALTIGGPQDPPAATVGFVRLRRGNTAGNRWRVRIGQPVLRLGGAFGVAGLMDGPTYRLRGTVVHVATTNDERCHPRWERTCAAC